SKESPVVHSSESSRHTMPSQLEEISVLDDESILPFTLIEVSRRMRCSRTLCRAGRSAAGHREPITPSRSVLLEWGVGPGNVDRVERSPPPDAGLVGVRK